MPTHYIFIGNPGTGKSTLLNFLCNQNVFEGGYTVGCALTSTQKQHTIGHITYTDTPGLYDADARRPGAALGLATGGPLGAAVGGAIGDKVLPS